MPQPSEKLFEEVMADATTKADRARRRGERDAESARKKTSKEVQAQVEAIMAAARAEADLKTGQVMATLEIEAQRERLARFEEGLQKVHGQVLERLSSLGGDELRAARLRLAVEAAVQVPPDVSAVELAVPKAAQGEAAALAGQVASQAQQALGRQIAVTPARSPAAIDDGVVIRAEGGRVEIVQSFRERLRRLWPELRLGVAGKLFPQFVSGKETV